jgi:hypothetical protein
MGRPVAWRRCVSYGAASFGRTKLPDTVTTTMTYAGCAVLPNMLLIVFGCGFFPVTSSAQDLSPEQVLRDIRAGIPRLQSVEGRLRAWECRLEVTGGGSDPRSASMTVKRAGQSVLLQYQLPGVQRQVAVMTETEVFAVSASRKEESWVLTKHVKSNNQQDLKSAIAITLASHPLTAVSDGVGIFEFLDRPEFKPTGVRKVAENRVELDFQYSQPSGDPALSKSQTRGTLTLATDLDWSVVRLVSRTTGGDHAQLGHSDFKMDRRIHRDGDLIRVSEVTQYSSTTDARYSSTTNCKYVPLISESINPAEFTLPYYNIVALDEVEAFEDQPKFNWQLWGSLGVICLSLSLVLTWIVYRRKRRVN